MPPTGGLWYWALNMTKQNTQPIMRDIYCHHLNPSHQETLLSLHLKNELLWMAHQVTGTGHPFLQRRERGKPYHGRPCPTHRIHIAALIEISIYRGHEEAIIIAMSLSDIYNPKEGNASTEYSWFKGTHRETSSRLHPCDGIRPEHGLQNH